MTQVTVNLTDTFEDWRVKTNQICANQGDIATLTTTTQVSLVAAINEIDATSGMGSIVEDTSPQLGNDLDVQTYDIVSTANRPITITPNGSGDVILDGLKYPQADGTTGQFLKTDGAGQLSFAGIVADTSPQLGGSLDVNGQSIVSVSNGNITITPDGTGEVVIDGLSHPQADGTTGQFLKTDGSGQLSFDTVDTNLVNDLSPELGGDLNLNSNDITGTGGIPAGNLTGALPSTLQQTVFYGLKVNSFGVLQVTDSVGSTGTFNTIDYDDSFLAGSDTSFAIDSLGHLQVTLT